MKKILLGILLSTCAFAADSGVLITKSSGGGFVMPEYAGGETCEVYANKVKITHTLGYGSPTSLQLVEERNITLTGDVKLIIEKAKAEQITETPNSLCDGPSTYIAAGEGNDPLQLFSTGGCGSPQRQRNGVFSEKLRTIVNLYCPQTYMFADR
jgi:hypothetical protein